MSQFETAKKSDADPIYQERLFRMLTEPVHTSTDDIGIGSTRPTPLDPAYVLVRNFDNAVGSWHAPTPEQQYDTYAVKTAVAQVLFYADLLGVSKDGPIRKLLELETEAQTKNRISHNQHAFQRLVPALMERPADDTMLEIVKKARGGTADLPEMVRLIKEYPEMGSIETSSFYATAGGDEDYDPIRAAYEFAGTLVATFHDAEVKLGSGGMPPKEKDSTLVPGIKTRTQVIATIASHDSYTEMVMKYSFIEMKGTQKLLGLTTYLRTREHDLDDGENDDIVPELFGDFNDLPAELARILLGKMATGEMIDESE